MEIKYSIQQKLGKLIRNLRGKMTSESAAKKIGISQGHLSKIEQGKIPPTKDLLHRVIKTFKVNSVISRFLLAYGGYTTYDIMPHFHKIDSAKDEEIFFQLLYEDDNRIRQLSLSGIPSEFQIPEYRRQFLSLDMGNKKLQVTKEKIEEFVNVNINTQRMYQEKEIETQVILLETIFKENILMTKSILHKQIDYLLEQIEACELLSLRILKPGPDNIMPFSSFFLYGRNLLLCHSWYCELVIRDVYPDYYKLFEKTYKYHWERSLPEKDSIELLQYYKKK